VTRQAERDAVDNGTTVWAKLILANLEIVK